MLSFKEAFQYFATNFWAKIKSTFLTIEDGINGILLDPKWELVNTVTNNNSITLPSLDTFDELYIEMNNNNADTIVHQVCIKKNSLLSNTGVIYREILLDGIHDTQSYVTYNIATNKITPSYCEGVAISSTSNVTTKVYVKKYVVSENTTTLSSNIISYDDTISDVSANSLQGAIDGLNGTVGYEKKNFLNNTASSTVNNGLSFTVNSDKSITVSGTATSDTSFDILLDTEIPKGSYLLSGCPSGGSDSSYYMVLKVQYPDGLGLANRYVFNYGEDAPFVCNKDNTHITAQIYIKSGVTVNKTFYPMIRYSSITDDTYEPYVDDVDTRIDAVNTKIGNVQKQVTDAQGNIDELALYTLGTGKKNLLPNNLSTTTFQGITYTINDDKSITLNGTALTDGFWVDLPMTLKKGKYKVSGCPSGGSSSTYYVRIPNTKTNTVIKDIYNSNDVTIEVTEDTPINYGIRIKGSVTVTNLTFYPMIRESSISDSTYETYIYDVDTKVETLRGADYIAWGNGGKTTPTTETEYYSYTVTRKCLINLTFICMYNASPVKSMKIIRNAEPMALYVSTGTEATGQSITGCFLANPGQVVKCLATYTKESSNGVSGYGYIQYLE